MSESFSDAVVSHDGSCNDNNVDVFNGASVHEKFVRALLLGDLVLCERELYDKLLNLGFDLGVKYACLVIKVSEKEVDIREVRKLVAFLFFRKTDFILSFFNREVVLVKSLYGNISRKDLENLAQSIRSSLQKYRIVSCSIGIGTIVKNIQKITKSYKEAEISSQICEIFFTKKRIASYENLGIARLIHHLPVTVCKSYLKEVFDFDFSDFADENIEFAVQKLFESNLNLSEAAKRLFVHRNTLVYRFSRLKKKTGFDIRNFEDAMLLKMAMIVKRRLLYED
ncbi:MAG: helix-turn-helix domain-containing protein [Oscillospiraceae bacterium]|nr:helix-turn-helix domain-containing protein [Oscillospiraceae bacterium]